MKTKFFNALSLAVIMAMLVTSLALADPIANNIDTTIDPALEIRAITSGGSTTVGFYDIASNTDPSTSDANGCNSTGANPSTVTLSVPVGVTATPLSFELTGCGTANAVSVSFTSNVAGSYGIGIASVTGGKPGSLWNTAPAAFTLVVNPPSDTTPPVITPVVSGTLGNNGWYTSDVSVSWSVSDPESTITSTTGCGSSTVNTDTTGQTFTCSATSAGGTASQSVTIKRDATAPTISGSASPAPNGVGWNNTGVNVTFSCSDAISGVASCGPNQTLSSEGAGQSATGTAFDEAGNSTNAIVSGINIDLTAPSISGLASPAANSSGWNNSDVTVSFTCSDGLSGVASCGSSQTLSGEGAGQSATGSALDNAGNSNLATVSGINIDKTAPSVSASASPAANGYGWNNSSVTVSFSGSDALSGIDVCDSPVVLSGEGAGQSATGYCSDLAGNSASATASGINIDLTSPSVSLVGGPADGGVYYFGFVPATPSCSASDALSGLDGTCLVSGYGAGVGPHTVTATISDKAGNSASASASYIVLNWSLYGFYQPVDMNGVWNTVKGGSTVPLKFEIFAGTTELTNTSYVQSLGAYKVACTGGGAEDAIETVATGGTSLRYDSVSGQFIYNWQTPKKPGECYKVVMETLDGSKLTAFFKLK